MRISPLPTLSKSTDETWETNLKENPRDLEVGGCGGDAVGSRKGSVHVSGGNMDHRKINQKEQSEMISSDFWYKN